MIHYRIYCGRNYRITRKWHGWILRLIPYDSLRVTISSEGKAMVWVNGVLEYPDA